ncbi:hypothetical protein ACODT3_03250 [Streptomyces sp. 4.24]|uniref:hypothetical protein n=1 Tax=Streptomyces tritrimontium TaxID=3406573 RepID=UPI003BB5C84A
MNDPITLAATEYEEPRGLPDTTEVRPPAGPDDGPAADLDDGPGTDRDREAGPARAEGTGAAPIRTVLETAATGRPVKEVAALVSLLKESGQVPNPGHTALRAAAVSRPVHEVREMVTLLGEPPHEVVETDITLRAAALGRPIEDVALLVSILGTGDGRAPERGAVRAPAPPGRTAARPVSAPTPVPAPVRAAGARSAGARPPGGALGRALRWPVAFALLLCGALHVPGDLAGLASADPGGLLALAVTLLCLTAGALLAVRDTAAAWRTGAVVALGVAALHVVGGAVEFDPLAGAVTGSVAWAGVTAVLSAATGAVLAGLALQYRPAADPADGA